MCVQQAEYGLIKVGELLMTCDVVNVNSKDLNGETPLSYATRRGRDTTTDVRFARSIIYNTRTSYDEVLELLAFPECLIPSFFSYGET